MNDFNGMSTCIRLFNAYGVGNLYFCVLVSELKDFNGMSTCIRLFNAYRVGNLYFCVLVSEFYPPHTVQLDTNIFRNTFGQCGLGNERILFYGEETKHFKKLWSLWINILNKTNRRIRYFI